MFEKRFAQFAIVAAGAVFAVCVTVIFFGGMRGANIHVAELGSVAPEIAIRDINNQNLTLSGLRGSFVLVYFTPDPIDANKPAVNASKPADIGGTQTAVTPIATLDSKLIQLNQLSDALNAKRVMVLEGEQSPSDEPMKLLGVAVNSNVDDASRSRMLLDSDGEIARNYRVDAIAAQPTLFVIDDHGVIRYRGSFEEASAENLMHKLVSVGSGRQFSTALPSPTLDSLAALNHF